MNLHDILKDLTYGELQGLKIGNLLAGEAESEPDPHQYEQIVSYINLGMTEIYKRFFLRSVEIYVQEHEEISTYLLHSNFAQSNIASVEDPKYIMDTADNPFQDDILKIEEVYDEEGNRYALNDTSDELSIYTPTFRSIQVPYPDDEVTIAVQYRANHPRIVVDVSTEAADIEVAIPNSLYEALLYFVGSRAHKATNAEKSADYWQMFKRSVTDVERLGLEVQGEPGDWRFDEHGWV